MTIRNQTFSKDAREQCDVMQEMFKKMESLYHELAEYYAFDKQKYTLEEFFMDLKTFKDSFIVSMFNTIALCVSPRLFCLGGKI